MRLDELYGCRMDKCSKRDSNPHNRNGQGILSPSCLPFHHSSYLGGDSRLKIVGKYTLFLPFFKRSYHFLPRNLHQRTITDALYHKFNP